MRWVAILACFSALAWAQTQPPASPKSQGDFLRAPDFVKLWRQASAARLAKVPGSEQREKPCSIPLVNVTPKVRSRMPVIPPERFGKTVEMPRVEVPAPPCPEEKGN